MDSDVEVVNEVVTIYSTGLYEMVAVNQYFPESLTIGTYGVWLPLPLQLE